MKLSELRPDFNVNATYVYLNGCTGLTEVPVLPNATYVELSGCTGLTEVMGKTVNTTEQAAPYLCEIAKHALAGGKLEMSVVHTDCGTSHCIAGWAGVLFPNQVRKGFELVDAIPLLGNEAHSVFYEDNETGRAFLERFSEQSNDT